MKSIANTPIAQAKTRATIMVTPTVPISVNISLAASALSPAAVKNGGKGVTSPCKMCSPASKALPPNKVNSK